MIIRNRHIIFFLFLILSLNVFPLNCDKSSLDSLKQLAFSREIETASKIDHLNQIAKCYLDIDIDSSAHYAGRANTISKQINYKRGLAVSFLRLGHVEETLGNYDRALLLFEKTIELFETIDKDRDYISALNSIGVISEERQDYDRAIENYLKGLKESEKQDFKYGEAFFCNNLYVSYMNIGSFERAIAYIQRASVLFLDLGETDYYANSLLNIGNYYYEALKDYDSALVYFRQAEKLQIENGNHYGLTNLYKNLGNIALQKEEPAKALDYYKKSLAHAELISPLDPNREYMIASANKYLGYRYLAEKAFLDSKEHFRISYSKGQSIKSLYMQKEGSYGLYSCFQHLNDLDSSQYYLDIYLVLNDSLLAEKYNEKIDKLNYNFQLEKERELMAKDKELILLEKKKEQLRYIALVAVFFIIALVAIIVWYFQKLKLQKTELLRENLRLENLNIANNLDKKNRELTTNVIYLLKKNEFITTMSDKLKDLTSDTDPATRIVIKNLIRDMDNSIKRDAWEEFEIRFNEVHVGFYNSLNKKHPGLSPNELRLSAFLRLNMSSKEISTITFQSFQSIKIARYRLRKKLGLEKGANLVSYLNRF